MLPIEQCRAEIISALKTHQVIVVVGETGSGKTTRIPVFLYQAGFGESGIIGITEPRRIAATSVAHYVASQLNSPVGQLVGYQVRFENRTGETALKFMTGGILLREFQEDPDLRKYSVIMVDEAHERSQEIDFILGLLKDLLKRRTDLKVIVASATIDVEKFSNYFGKAPVIQVSGTVYPVQVSYYDGPISLYDDRGRPTMKYMAELVADKVAEIHLSQDPGDILVFMSGKDDIMAIIEQLEAKGFRDLVVLPAYGGLTLQEQERIFSSFPGKRKVVVATNIAETSITIDGIVFVVDSGFIKQNNFHPESGIQSLDLVRHSRAGCDQRKGRAGRTKPGICFRMYSEKDYQERPTFTEPEIRRVSIAGVVLSMEDLGIGHIEFMDPPDKKAFQEAYETLTALGAIVPDKGITELGRQMARLPLEPRTARMVLEAKEHGCVKQIATIAAFLSVPHIYVRPKGKEWYADTAHSQFQDPDSDLMSFLRIWKAYEASGFSSSWCNQNYLNSRSLVEVEKVRQQLFDVLKYCEIPLSEADDKEVILTSAVAGLIQNLMEVGTRHSYAGMFKRSYFHVYIHPGSGLFNIMPRWLVATDVVQTTKLYARNCTTVTATMLRKLLPHLITEKVVILSVADDGTSVQARKSFHFTRSSLGGEYAPEVENEEITLSVEDAKKIQDERIAQAGVMGWRKVVFTRSNEFGTSLFAEDGTRCLSYGYDTGSSIQLGVPYYCAPESISVLDKWVRPKFRVFDLKPKVEETVTQAALRLAKAWLPQTNKVL